MQVVVNFPVIFDFPDDKVTDDIEETREAIKDFAGKLLETSTVKPVIAHSENEEYKDPT